MYKTKSMFDYLFLDFPVSNDPYQLNFLAFKLNEIGKSYLF